MSKKAVILSAIFLGLAGMGFALYQFVKRELLLAQSYCYKFGSVNVITVNENRFTIDLTIKIKNQSDLRITITNYNFKIFINDKQVLTLSSVANVDVLANAVSELTVRIDFDPSSVFNLSDIASLGVLALTNQSQFFITLSGTIDAKVNFISIKNLPFNKKMSLAQIMAPDNADPTAKLDCNIV
jgi:LEA14-like dessication related protein